VVKFLFTTKKFIRISGPENLKDFLGKRDLKERESTLDLIKNGE